jgi:hypothetical protein
LENIVELEYAYLPLLSYSSSRSLRIQTLMGENPKFSHQILRTAFKGKNEIVGESTEGDKQRAQRGYRLLTQFSNITGYKNDVFDGNFLRAWIDEFRRLGVETDRAAVTDNFIGRLLAHSPVDPDGGWPHSVIREELERLQNVELERGIQLERFNMRGVYGKEIFEGGGQERALAQQSIRWAETALRWPRLLRYCKRLPLNGCEMRSARIQKQPKGGCAVKLGFSRVDSLCPQCHDAGSAWNAAQRGDRYTPFCSWWMVSICR